MADNRKDLEAGIQAQSQGQPFKRCECGSPIGPSQSQCPECARLYALGMKTPPQVAKDTQPAQSFPSAGSKRK